MEKKKFDGVLICSDIDGTLFFHSQSMEKGLVPENACKAIKYFQDNGGRFTLATGRFPRYAATALSQFITPNAPLVTLNGTVIYDAKLDKMLSKCPLNDDIARLSYDVINKIPTMTRTYLHCDGNVSYSIKRDGSGGFVYKNELDAADTYRPILSREHFSQLFGDAVVFKVLYIFREEDSDSALAEITEMFPEYAISRSWINGIELNRADADKAHGTRFLADLLGDVKLLVCVGDFENDISMLKAADIGYAVASARDEVKAAADRVTVKTCAEGAIEEIIEDLERELGSSNKPSPQERT